MKQTPEQIAIIVMKDMQGIGGIPTNEEFFTEFTSRYKAALGLHAVSKSVICPNCEEDCNPVPLGYFCNKCYYDKL